MTKEENEAQEKVDEYLRGILQETETGMPALPSWAMAADSFGTNNAENFGIGRR